MSIDLNGLSAKELDTLIANAKKRRTTLSKRKPIAEVRRKLTALARAEGLFGRGTVRRRRGGTGEEGRLAQARAQVDQGLQARQGRAEVPQSAEPVGNLGGRGQQPKWMASQIAAGRKLDDFLIK
jgi:DNA-binding protein H-NS